MYITGFILNMKKIQSMIKYPKCILNLKFINNLRIPIPSRSEQERIVTIFDKFDELTNASTEGLPREIELRRQQYEYCRDMLFKFLKPKEVA